MKTRVALIVLLSLSSILRMYGQRFSDNTELKLLNKYFQEFNIRPLSNKEQEDILNNILKYVHNYEIENPGKINPQKNVLYRKPIDEVDIDIRAYDKRSDLLHLRRHFYLRSMWAIDELKSQKRERTISPNIFKDSLSKFLKVPIKSTIVQLESYTIKLTNADSLKKATKLLANYYEHMDYRNEYDFVSLEKLIYYLNKLVLLYEGDPYQQRIFLRQIGHNQWRTFDNFYITEKQLSAAIKAYEKSKQLNDHRLIALDKTLVLNILVGMLIQSADGSTISSVDKTLLNSVVLSLIYKEVKSHDVASLDYRFNLIGRYLYHLGQSREETEKCFMLAGVFSFQKKTYNDFIVYHGNYLLLFGNKDTVLIPAYEHLLSQAWDDQIELTHLVFDGNPYLVEFARFNKYVNLFYFEKNLKGAFSVLTGEKLKLHCDSLVKVSVDSLTTICDRMDVTLPYNSSYSYMYANRNADLADVVNILEEENILAACNFMAMHNQSFPNDIRWNLRINSIRDSSDGIHSYYLLKLTNQIPHKNLLWQYKALLNGELNAIKDGHELQIAKSNEGRIFALNKQKETELERNKALSKHLQDSTITANEREKFIAKQKNDAELISKERKISAIVVGGLIILLLFIAGWYSTDRKKKNKIYNTSLEKERAHKEFALAKSKLFLHSLNPHIIRNLKEVLTYVSSTADLTTSERLHFFDSIYYPYFDFILELQDKDLISIHAEVEALRRYIELVKYICKFSFEERIQNNLSFDVLPLILQPMLENTINYAFESSSDNNRIILEAKNLNDAVEVIFADNGIGISDSQKGLGLTSIESRLNLFNVYANRHIFSSLEILNNTNNLYGFSSGTILKFKVYHA